MADDIIRQLGLEPHPEGGHYRETWRAPAPAGERSAGTAIYYLLREGEVSHWHRVDATEIWHWYAGSPLQLSLSADGKAIERLSLGNDLGAGPAPPDHRAGGLLAKRAQPRRMDTGRLHRIARLRVQGVRDGAVWSIIRPDLII